jgi:hypothetical protein
MDMLNDSSVDLAAGIDAFDLEDNVEGIDDEEEKEGEGDEAVDDEEVVEVDPAAAGSSAPPKPRTSNYTEIEDATLVRAWSRVGILFYGVGIRGLLARTSFRPVKSEYRALYSRFMGQKNRGSIRHALRAPRR